MKLTCATFCCVGYIGPPLHRSGAAVDPWNVSQTGQSERCRRIGVCRDFVGRGRHIDGEEPREGAVGGARHGNVELAANELQRCRRMLAGHLHGVARAQDGARADARGAADRPLGQVDLARFLDEVQAAGRIGGGDIQQAVTVNEGVADGAWRGRAQQGRLHIVGLVVGVVRQDQRGRPAGDSRAERGSGPDEVARSDAGRGVLHVDGRTRSPQAHHRLPGGDEVGLDPSVGVRGSDRREARHGVPARGHRPLVVHRSHRDDQGVVAGGEDRPVERPAVAGRDDHDDSRLPRSLDRLVERVEQRRFGRHSAQRHVQHADVLADAVGDDPTHPFDDGGQVGLAVGSRNLDRHQPSPGRLALVQAIGGCTVTRRSGRRQRCRGRSRPGWSCLHRSDRRLGAIAPRSQEGHRSRCRAPPR